MIVNPVGKLKSYKTPTTLKKENKK